MHKRSSTCSFPGPSRPRREPALPPHQPELARLPARRSLYFLLYFFLVGGVHQSDPESEGKRVAGWGSDYLVHIVR